MLEIVKSYSKEMCSAQAMGLPEQDGNSMLLTLFRASLLKAFQPVLPTRWLYSQFFL